MLIGTGSRRQSASQAVDLPSDGGVNFERLFTLCLGFSLVQPLPCGLPHGFPRGSVVVQGSMLDSLDHVEGRRGQELTLVAFGWLTVFASTSLSVARFHPPRLTYPAPKATHGQAQSEGPQLQPKHPLR